MEQIIQIGIWLGGGFGGIIMLLLGWIAFMIREDKRQNQSNYQLHDKRLKKHDKVLIKHDKKFDKQHIEIKNLIEVLKPKI